MSDLNFIKKSIPVTVRGGGGPFPQWHVVTGVTADDYCNAGFTVPDPANNLGLVQIYNGWKSFPTGDSGPAFLLTNDNANAIDGNLEVIIASSSQINPERIEIKKLY